MKIKIIIGISLLLLCLGAASATDIVDIFKAPSSLQPMGTSAFVDQQGHNLDFIEYNDHTRQVWFENDTELSYNVEPYQGNDTFYMYEDGAESDPNALEAKGLIEIVEKDGVKYIINSWTANDSDNDFKMAYDNLLEFNKLNQLKPLTIDDIIQ